MSIHDPQFSAIRGTIENHRWVQNHNWEWIRSNVDRFKDMFAQHTLAEINTLISELEIHYDNYHTFEVSSVVTARPQDGNQPTEYSQPVTHITSCWSHYKQHLRTNKRFSDSMLTDLEFNVSSIMREMSPDSKTLGLAVGYVQSGKTATFAGLMAWGADHGFNFFVILSGTIENLRRQTKNRLLTDLGQHAPRGISWHAMDHLAGRLPRDDARQLNNLRISIGRPERYFTVCLKNATRLTHMVKYFAQNSAIAQQLKIMIIDDESDQGGINTQDAEHDPTVINALIRSIVHGQAVSSFQDALLQAEKYRRRFANLSEPPNKKVQYIQFTATPYANVLNRGPQHETELYPRNYIVALKTGPSYFGSSRIFGVAESDPEAENQDMGIVCDISDADRLAIGDLHSRGSNLPPSLIDALLWFLCAVAVQRVRGVATPVTMLIHTSSAIAHHNRLAEAVETWLTNCRDIVIEQCRKVYRRIGGMLNSVETFNERCPDYPENVIPLPPFDKCESFISGLIERVNKMDLFTEEEERYHKGIHICIDNSAPENRARRLNYPDPDEHQEAMQGTPAFLVIGGATLSRGLTLEGLVSSYFLRESTCNYDTLMQMGRWFGYRRGYELLPRIWVTDRTRYAYNFLSKAEISFREQIEDARQRGKTPAEMPPAVMAHPDNLLRITAPNRMQDAKLQEIDLAGTSPQTIHFHNNEKLLKQNIHFAQDLIKKLKTPRKDERDVKNLVFGSVTLDLIIEFLRKYNAPDSVGFLKERETIIEYLNRANQQDKWTDWNVVVCGRPGLTGRWGNDDEEFKDYNGYKVKRAKEKPPVSEVIFLHSVLSPRDLWSDVIVTKSKEEQKTMLLPTERRPLYAKRKEAGLGQTPALLIYCIDRNSKAPTPKPNAERQSHKLDLNAPCDLLAFVLLLPPPVYGREPRFLFSVSAIEESPPDIEP